MPVALGPLFQGGSYIAVVREATLTELEGKPLSVEDLTTAFFAALCSWDLLSATHFADRLNSKDMLDLVSWLRGSETKRALATISLFGQASVIPSSVEAAARGAILGKAKSVMVSLTPPSTTPDFKSFAESVGATVAEVQAAQAPRERSQEAWSTMGWSQNKISKVGEVAAAMSLPGMK